MHKKKFHGYLLGFVIMFSIFCFNGIYTYALETEKEEHNSSDAVEKTKIELVTEAEVDLEVEMDPTPRIKLEEKAPTKKHHKHHHKTKKEIPQKNSLPIEEESQKGTLPPEKSPKAAKSDDIKEVADPTSHTEETTSTTVKKNIPKLPIASFKQDRHTPYDLTTTTRKRLSIFTSSEMDSMIPENICTDVEEGILTPVNKKHINLSVTSPSTIEKTPCVFSIDVNLENKTEEEINGINVGISFGENSEELALVPPIPIIRNAPLINNNRFAFNIKVGNVHNAKRATFCVYVSKNSKDKTGQPIEYLITAHYQQLYLNQSEPNKAIIIIPGICGSELFSGSAQRVDKRQYSKGYRIWPPEGAVKLVEGNPCCTCCNTMKLDTKRLWSDISLILCNEDGSSQIDVMLSNPIRDCRKNPDHRNFGTINCYGKLVESIINEKNNDGYKIVFFSYDWRMSNAKTALALQDFMKKNDFTQSILIAHSMGGLLTASYMTKPENQSRIEKVILLGAPLLGAPKAFATFDNGTFFDGIIGKLTSLGPDSAIKLLVSNCQSVYELLPPRQYFTYAKESYPRFSMKHGYLLVERESLNPFKKDYKISDYTKTLEVFLTRKISVHTNRFLGAAQNFHDSLYDTNGKFILSSTNLDVYNIVGFGLDTTSVFYIDLKSSRHCHCCQLGHNKKLHFKTTDGDGTVSIDSSTLIGRFPDTKSYYLRGVTHMELMSEDVSLDLINNIIAGNPEVFDPTKIQKILPDVSDGCGASCCCILPICSCFK